MGAFPPGRSSIANTSGLLTRPPRSMEVGFMGLQQSLEELGANPEARSLT